MTVPRLLATGVGCAAVVLWASHTVRFSRDFHTRIWWGPRHERYERVSAWVNEHARADASLMASEFGTLGYLTGRRMIDTVGLINWTNDYPRRRSFDDLVRLVRHYRPDLVLVDVGVQGLLMERAVGYRVVKFFDWQVYASTLLARGPDALARPEEFEALRREVPGNLASRPRAIAYDAP